MVERHVSLYHVEPEEGHTYWYEISNTLPSPRASQVRVEMPSGLVEDYAKAVKEVERIEALIAPYGAEWTEANKCVVCNDRWYYGGHHHTDASDFHEYNPAGRDV